MSETTVTLVYKITVEVPNSEINRTDHVEYVRRQIEKLIENNSDWTANVDAEI